MQKKSVFKIQSQIIILVSLLTVFQLVICVVSFYGINAINTDLDIVFTKRLPAINNLVQADRDFQQALVAERTLLLENISEKTKASQITDYLKNRKQVIDRFNIYEKLATSNKEKDLIKEFKANYESWAQVSDKKLGISKGGMKFSGSAAIEDSLNIVGKSFEASRDQMDKLQEIILKFADFEFTSAQKEFKNTIILLASIVLGCFALTVILSFVFIRSINNKIRATIANVSKESDLLTSISKDLSQKATQLASSSQQQSASVTETSSSLHEISQMVKKNTSTAVESANLVNEGKRELDRGIKMIFDLAEKVKEINKASDELIGKVDHNHQRFEEILGVFNNVQEKTSVINDIVFQTKLLSFNASVEAARAGEHGKGFSVVAEEVGNLAQMSGKSANEIAELLEGSLSNVSSIISNSKEEVNSSVKKNEAIIDQTLKISSDCEKILKEIDQMFMKVTNSTNEIATASKEQSSGVGEINTAVQEIDTANQLTTNNANKVEEDSISLSEVAVNLEDNLIELRKLVA
ncbi:methyl-accepting chemotaxis protein [Halobacteriovorax sp. HLS]|uniref:HAMP domain-containing methyl-accepting chemotaxis protein n=1 Tax=Halobacteriovorax sp. HLS TaxID=2234000 RepID=UPI000FD6EB21|nr:methyl-accepting chemotaxis protein [Halobacteriovorax sp. HLS]